MMFAISTIKIRINMFEFKKSHPVGNVRVEKRGSENWSNMRSFSVQKNDLLFDH